MILLRYLLLFLILGIKISPFAQDNTESAQIVYFKDYVNVVVYKLPDIQLNNLKKIEAEKNILIALKQKEWGFSVRSGMFQESDFTGNIDSPFIFQTGWEIAAEINKTFVTIGGRMNLDFSFRNFTARGVVNGITEEQEFYVPILTFQYAQPLLKNAFGVLDRLPITLAGLDQKIADWTSQEENSYLLSNYKKLYMQWVVYDQIRDFLYTSLDNALELEKLSQNQRNIGYIDEVDFQNARMLTLEIQNELLDVESTYANLIHQISFLVGDTNIRPDPKEWDLLIDAVNNDSFEGISFEETRQALILEFMQEKLTHSAGALKNSRLPELNLLLTAAMEVYSTNTASEPSDIIIVPAYYVGAQFKYPFGDMDYQANARGLYKNKQEYHWIVQKYQNDYQYKTKEKERNLTFYREKINNRTATQQALETRYTSQYTKFSQGRDILANLVETRNRLLKNRIEEADVQLRLIFEYFDFMVLNNRDEISLGLTQ